jgi:hypothetical protein
MQILSKGWRVGYKKKLFWFITSLIFNLFYFLFQVVYKFLSIFVHGSTWYNQKMAQLGYQFLDILIKWILFILINCSFVKLLKKFLHLNGIDMYIFSQNGYWNNFFWMFYALNDKIHNVSHIQKKYQSYIIWYF